jgi:hypothetical protein
VRIPGQVIPPFQSKASSDSSGKPSSFWHPLESVDDIPELDRKPIAALDSRLVRSLLFFMEREEWCRQKDCPMSAEMTAHVGYEKHDSNGNNTGNSRNGTSPKTINGTFGAMPIEVPRDRNGTFEPQIIEKHQKRFMGFDDNIISLYARGVSTSEIQQKLPKLPLLRIHSEELACRFSMSDY